MKLHEISLRIPFSIRSFDLVEEAASRLPVSANVSRIGEHIHVDATVSAYEIPDAYRYLWKELCLRLASRKPADPAEQDEWSELLADHAMQMRSIVEQFCQLLPQVDDELDGHPVGSSLKQLCLSAQEMLDALGRKEEPSV